MIGRRMKPFRFLKRISIRASNALDKKSDTEIIQEALQQKLMEIVGLGNSEGAKNDDRQANETFSISQLHLNSAASNAVDKKSDTDMIQEALQQKLMEIVGLGNAHQSRNLNGSGSRLQKRLRPPNPMLSLTIPHMSFEYLVRMRSGIAK
jgi:hypothetical protein